MRRHLRAPHSPAHRIAAEGRGAQVAFILGTTALCVIAGFLILVAAGYPWHA